MWLSAESDALCITLHLFTLKHYATQAMALQWQASWLAAATLWASRQM